MNSFDEEVLNHLRPLVGLRLSIARRAADLRNFQFGTIRPHRNGTVGEYALHIQCPWRIEGPNGIVTGRTDLWKPAEVGKDFDWSSWTYETSLNLQDKLIGELLRGRDEKTGSSVNETGLLVVEDVRADKYGGVEIHLSGNYRLVIFPAGKAGEYWRLFRPGSEDHFVVGTGPGSKPN